jgi:hypothetical protein
MTSSIKQDFVFEKCLPKSIQPLISNWLLNDIDLVLYGSAIPDYYLGIKPNDYDFYVGCSYKDFMERVGNSEGLNLHKYGEYITPAKDVYYFISQERIKYDLKFIDEKHFDADHLYSSLYTRGLVTLSSFLYFVRSKQLIDKYGATKDIKNKTIRLSDIKKVPSHESMEKTFILYFTFLCGKYHDFSVDKSQLGTIKKYIQEHRHKLSYFKEFPWRIPAGLARVFDYPQGGLENIIKYWTQVELFSIFCEGIATNRVHEIFFDAKLSSEAKLQELNKASNRKIADSFRRAVEQMPLDFLASQEGTISIMRKLR